MREPKNGFDLSRFIKSQKRDFSLALEEIRSGRKTSHWMWYIFPQLKGLGYSGMSQYYGLDGVMEAAAYMEDKTLRSNLITICQALLALEGKSADEIFGYPDNYKLRSCMTLFLRAAPDCPIFREVLDKYFGGVEDEKTLCMLEKEAD